MTKMRILTNYNQSHFFIESYQERWFSRLKGLFMSDYVKSYHWVREDYLYFSLEDAQALIERVREREAFLENHNGESSVVVETIE